MRGLGGVADAALAALVASRGRLGVEVLARRMGCSARHLRAVVRAALRVGPATAARLLRAEAAIEAIGGTDAPLAAVALDAGFADQAHMTRAVRELAGATPARLRSVQDAVPDPAQAPCGPSRRTADAHPERRDRDPRPRRHRRLLRGGPRPALRRLGERRGRRLRCRGAFRVGPHEWARRSPTAILPSPDIEAAVEALRSAGGEASDPSPEEPAFGRVAQRAATGGVVFGPHGPA